MRMPMRDDSRYIDPNVAPSVECQTRMQSGQIFSLSVAVSFLCMAIASGCRSPAGTAPQLGSTNTTLWTGMAFAEALATVLNEGAAVHISEVVDLVAAIDCGMIPVTTNIEPCTVQVCLPEHGPMRMVDGHFSYWYLLADGTCLSLQCDGVPDEKTTVSHVLLGERGKGIPAPAVWLNRRNVSATITEKAQKTTNSLMCAMYNLTERFWQRHSTDAGNEVDLRLMVSRGRAPVTTIRKGMTLTESVRALCATGGSRVGSTHTMATVLFQSGKLPPSVPGLFEFALPDGSHVSIGWTYRPELRQQFVVERIRFQQFKPDRPTWGRLSIEGYVDVDHLDLTPYMKASPTVRRNRPR